MADIPFQYDDEVLSSCATSSYAEALLGSGGEIASKSRVNRVDLSCQKLFQQYASHYGRDRDAANDTQNHDRLHRFISNVVFVYRHNNELLDDDETNEPAGDEDEDDDIDVAGTSAAPRHRITLNRFSDRHEHELPLMDEGVAEEFLPNFESLPLLGVENEYYGESRELGGAGSIFSKLEFEHLVQSVTDDATTSSVAANIGAFRSYFLSDRHRFEDEVQPLPGSASSSSQVFIWSKKGQSSLYLERETDRKRHSVRKEKMDWSDATPYAPPPDGRSVDRFRKSLDWSTTDNPDAVPIVHPVIDQGSCGACWAISATGTVEANAARHRAFEAYTDTEKRLTAKKLDSDEIRKAAIAAAREAETKAFSKADLSIQELLDCDTRYDQGCTGGNPLLAYYFIHRYGLTDSSQYPYKGKQKECKVDQVTSPIATAEGWGVLTPNHEDNMELVLRYIGPIAVGVNGSERDFLAHEGGIFHSKKCGQNANHAMLIVGYGQETNKKTGKVTRYWIARNSWGTGWGEKGYVRMKRGSGKKGKRGVCGIARSPSVALGSSLLASETRSQYIKKSSESHNRAEPSQSWLEALVRCQDRGGAPIPCTDYRHFALQHFTMASVVLTMLLVGTWLRTKLTQRTTKRHITVHHNRKYQPTGNKLVDSLEMPTSDERTNLIGSDPVERGYGSSYLNQ